MSISRFGRFSLVFFATILFFSFWQPAKADVITIIPPRFDLFGNPGDIVNEKLQVRNDGGNDVVYQTDVVDFQAAGDEGGVNLIDDPAAPKTPFSLYKWVTLEPSRFSVAAGQTKTLNVAIHIPKDAEPGSHLASVQVNLSGPAVSGGGASVQSQLNSLLLLRVSGNTTEKLTLEKFTTDNSYYQHGPVDFIMSTKNEGNVHLAPIGKIIITDIFGHKVKEIPLKSANVLPTSTRTIHTLWDDKNLVGRYTATLDATYSQGKQTLNASTTFTVIPLSLVWLVLGLIIIILLILTQRKTVKKLLHNLTSE